MTNPIHQGIRGAVAQIVAANYTTIGVEGEGFAGLGNRRDVNAVQNQELLLAYTSGLIRLLVEKGIITQSEFEDAVMGWLEDRKVWAETQMNAQYAIFDLPSVDIDSLEGATTGWTPVWPWNHMQSPA